MKYEMSAKELNECIRDTSNNICNHKCGSSAHSILLDHQKLLAVQHTRAATVDSKLLVGPGWCSCELPSVC